MDELERAGRAVRDAVAVDIKPSDRVRARARTIVRRRRMFAAGAVVSALIATSVGIAIAASGDNGLGVHTIAPAGSSTTRSMISRPGGTTILTTTAPREVDAAVQSMPLLAFADPLHGWRVEPLLYRRVERTVDGGRTWTAQLAIPEGNSVSGVVAVDDRNAFALVSDGADPLTRLMRTTDGTQWQQTVGSERLAGPLTFVSFVDPTRGWGLTRYGDLVTTADAGNHWKAMTQPDPGNVGQVGSVCLEASESGWAANGDTVYRTDDDGASWRRQVKIPAGGGSSIALACNGSRAAYASFSVGAGQHFGAFIRTDDDGARWRPYTEDREDSAGGFTTVTAPGFPANQQRGSPSVMTADGTLVFVTGCYACSPSQNWVVAASPTDRFVVGHPDSTSHQTLLVAATASDATHLFAEVQTIPGDGTGPRPVSCYASSDGGHTWQVRWTGQ